MRAVALYAEDKGPPPVELIEGFRSRQWGLPEAGGRLDQPAGLVMQMNYALQVYDAWSGYLQAEIHGRNVEYIGQDPQLRKLVYEIMEAKK